MHQITIVVVTYEDEFPLLLMQAISLAKFVNLKLVREVIWVINQSNSIKKNKIFFEMAKKIIKEKGFNLKCIERSFLVDELQIQNMNGWRSQQILKLMVAKEVSSQFYLLIDTKNFFIKPVNLNILFKGTKLRSFKWKCAEILKPMFVESMNSLQCRISPKQFLMPTATPYLMVKKVVIDLLNEKVNFFDFFSSNSNLTEFFLYYAFLKKNNLIRRYYYFKKQNYITFFSSYPSSPSDIKSSKKRISRKYIYCMGFHRDRFKSKDLAFKDFIKKTWFELGLVESDSLFESIYFAMSSGQNE